MRRSVVTSEACDLCVEVVFPTIDRRPIKHRSVWRQMPHSSTRIGDLSARPRGKAVRSPAAAQNTKGGLQINLFRAYRPLMMRRHRSAPHSHLHSKDFSESLHNPIDHLLHLDGPAQQSL